MCRTCFPDIHGHRTMIPICGRMFVCVVFLQLVPMGSGNLKNRVHWRDRHFVDLFLCGQENKQVAARSLVQLPEGETLASPPIRHPGSPAAQEGGRRAGAKSKWYRKLSESDSFLYHLDFVPWVPCCFFVHQAMSMRKSTAFAVL